MTPTRAPIERLPVELVELIIAHFTLCEHQSLRLVSRQLYALTLSAFSSRYFTKRTTTLSAPSLARLQQASASHFSQSVSLLDVKLLNYEEYQSLHKISRVGIYPPPKRFQQVACIKPRDVSKEYALFEYLRDNDDPKDVVRNLSQALEQLSHVQTLRMRVNGEALQSSSMLEGDQEEEYPLFVHACFKAVIAAIVRSGVKLHVLSLIKGSKVRLTTKSANLIYPAFNFPFSFLSSISKAFSSLKTLRLSIRTDFHDNARVPGWQNGISQFIAAASALEDLTLCFSPLDKELGFKAAVMRSLASSLDLENLTSLHMYESVADEQDWVRLAEAHPSLRQIILSNARLLKGTWSTVLRTFRESLNLHLLRLYYLYQRGTPQDDWWTWGLVKMPKTRLDTTDRSEKRTMDAMLSETIEYLNLLSTNADELIL